MIRRATNIRKHVHTWAPWRFAALAVYRKCTMCEHVQSAERTAWTAVARELPAGVRHLADVPWEDVGPRERASADTHGRVWRQDTTPTT